ncbi:MAG: Holliday junction branch migration protein RuvA [Armatimonadota bacterium]|nr:Holliday junction branch migration protein RuvA [Armatimonadota bacterium]MDR5703628.1 Holliday junction branch migration protein RuvA [Armatimonadota bacterium]
MIAYLRGRLVRRTEETVVVEAGGVGYEVHLPAVVAQHLKPTPSPEGEVIELFISYHVTPNQPRPLLVGFLREAEQEFFERFITVDGLGPLKALRAIVRPIHEIADAVERKDVDFLRHLPGIGGRTAEKIVASLHGKMAKFALLQEEALAPPAPTDIREEALEILTKQLGHRIQEARKMVEEAMARNPRIETTEELLQEIYKVKRRGEAHAKGAS